MPPPITMMSSGAIRVRSFSAGERGDNGDERTERFCDCLSSLVHVDSSD